MKNYHTPIKILLTTLGILSLVLGIIGIFVPLLPTTPFVLLSAYLFAKSSPELHHWLLNHKTFGQYIRDYTEEKAIPMKVKITAITFLWTSILAGIFFMLNGKWWLQLLLLSIAVGVSIHILSLKTKR